MKASARSKSSTSTIFMNCWRRRIERKMVNPFGLTLISPKYAPFSPRSSTLLSAFMTSSPNTLLGRIKYMISGYSMRRERSKEWSAKNS
jgi:hypothetical protein